MSIKDQSLFGKAAEDNDYVWAKIKADIWDSRNMRQEFVDQMIRYYVSRGLRRNEWTQEAEFEGKPVDYQHLWAYFENKVGIDKAVPPDSKVKRAFEYTLERNQYSPVKEYFNGLAGKEYREEIWNNLFQKIFRYREDAERLELYDAALKIWLVSAVQRVFEPGCYFRHSLILQGPQAIGKTQFFKILAGRYYLSADSDSSDLESIRLLHGAWIVELAEFESYTSKKSVENLKRFITTDTDKFRPLYSNQPKEAPRHCVFGGSANSREVLLDKSNTRFWVIPLEHQLDLEFLKANRDEIWRCAYQHYKLGTYGIEEVNKVAEQFEVNSDEFKHEDPVSSKVELALEELQQMMKGTEFLFKAADLAIFVDAHKTRAFTNCLYSLGYGTKVFRDREKTEKFWGRTDALNTLEKSEFTVLKLDRKGIWHSFKMR